MFKKIVATLALTLFAANAFAEATVAVPTGLQGFNLSKSVSVAYEASTGKDTYAGSSKHLQGDKCYGGTSASSYIWFKNCTAGTALATGDNPTVPDTPSDAAVSNGYSQM